MLQATSIHHRPWPRALLALAAAGVLTTGCYGHRYYDGYRQDYHRWNGQERGYYGRWETEGRREHRDYDRRGDGDQRDYWRWRHDH
jgi:hypothetical protein